MTSQQRINKIVSVILNSEPETLEDLFKSVAIPKNWGFAPRYDKNNRVVDLSFYDGKNHNYIITLPTDYNIYLT